MPMYLMRGKYSNSACKGMITNPHDRGAAAKAMFKVLGLKTHDILVSVSTGAMTAAMKKAGAVASKYKPPNQ